MMSISNFWKGLQASWSTAEATGCSRYLAAASFAVKEAE